MWCWCGKGERQTALVATFIVLERGTKVQWQCDGCMEDLVSLEHCFSPPALVGADVWELFHLTQTAGHDPGKEKDLRCHSVNFPKLSNSFQQTCLLFFSFSSHPLPGLIHHTGEAMPVCHGTFQRDQCLPPAQPRSQTRSSLLHPSTGDADWRSNANYGQK